MKAKSDNMSLNIENLNQYTGTEVFIMSSYKKKQRFWILEKKYFDVSDNYIGLAVLNAYFLGILSVDF